MRTRSASRETFIRLRLTEPRPGVYVFDMGQNMVGWCRLKVRGTADAFINVRHAEHSTADGRSVRSIFSTPRPTDTYTKRTDGEETFEPHFTYHGFRYVQITGLPSRRRSSDLVGRVVHSNAPLVSNFECSTTWPIASCGASLWTQWGNMQSIPTDCPQRSERLGWMGDIQAFLAGRHLQHGHGGVFQQVAAGHPRRPVRQRRLHCPDAAFPHRPAQQADHVAPGGVYGTFAAAPAWSDAGASCPGGIYENYGDTRILEEQFEAARSDGSITWTVITPDTHLFINGRGEQYNDWLGGGGIPTDMFSTSFFAYSTDTVMKMAAALGRADDARHYAELFQKIKAAFRKRFLKPDGSLEIGSQSCYVFALQFNLLNEAERPAAIARVLADLKLHAGQMTTGIQASHRLLLELTRDGHHDDACNLFNNRSFPSWGAMIDRGATTVWENLSSPPGTPGVGASGNHFAHASVAEWLWKYIVGIQVDDAAPGYKHFTLAPQPGPGFTWAKGDSAHDPRTNSLRLAIGKRPLHA